MKNDWQERLKTAVDEDPRSMRALSLEAGLGPNYLEQTFNRGSAPTQDKLAKVLDKLGEEAAIYVYTGVRLSANDIELIKAFDNVPDDVRRSAIDLMKRLSSHPHERADMPKLSADLNDPATAKE